MLLLHAEKPFPTWNYFYDAILIRYGVFLIVCNDYTTLTRVNVGQLAQGIHFSFPGCLVCQRVGCLYGKFLFRDIEVNLYIRVVEIDTLIICIVPVFPEKLKSYGIFQKEGVRVHQLD